MESDAERTLSNLHVVGALSHNDKLMTNEDTFDIYSPTSVRGFWRMWYRERRGANIVRVRQCVRLAIKFCDKAYEDACTLRTSQTSDQLRVRIDTITMQYHRMMDGLGRAKGGLQNLIQTYRSDAASASQVRLLVEEIEDYVCVMQKHTESLLACSPQASSAYVPILPPPRPAPPSSASSPSSSQQG